MVCTMWGISSCVSTTELDEADDVLADVDVLLLVVLGGSEVGSPPKFEAVAQAVVELCGFG